MIPSPVIYLPVHLWIIQKRTFQACFVPVLFLKCDKHQTLSFQCASVIKFVIVDRYQWIFKPIKNKNMFLYLVLNYNLHPVTGAVIRYYWILADVVFVNNIFPLIHPRGCCSWVWGGSDFPNTADTVAESGQWRVSPRVSGPGAHSALLGGTLPLQKGKRPEAQQKEAKGQEDQEEIRTRHRTI